MNLELDMGNGSLVESQKCSRHIGFKGNPFLYDECEVIEDCARCPYSSSCNYDIIYGGDWSSTKVLVYFSSGGSSSERLVLDDVPADRAKDLMLMAKNKKRVQTSKYPSNVSKDSNLPIARRASLHKFLAKRKGRALVQKISTLGSAIRLTISNRVQGKCEEVKVGIKVTMVARPAPHMRLPAGGCAGVGIDGVE
ncbi:hypothetical protein L1987_33742 [Smallanthus sonchifolius]|uniref:Uncharacterized protein n=1 Tax=Smallanthus sonchifolius TaxID=185202 RepID=A0ACB9HRW4_9ASTR|nr:hypothetical protein L1987_33742 [Smallanthus sonchifolius]